MKTVAPQPPKEEGRGGAKKTYTPPMLIEYGDVSKLTEAGGRSVTSDHGSNNMYS